MQAWNVSAGAGGVDNNSIAIQTALAAVYVVTSRQSFESDGSHLPSPPAGSLVCGDGPAAQFELPGLIVSVIMSVNLEYNRQNIMI